MDDSWFLLGVLDKDFVSHLPLIQMLLSFRSVCSSPASFFVNFLELAHAVAGLVRLLAVTTLDVIPVLVVAALNVILLAVDVVQFLHFHFLFGFAGLNFSQLLA